MYDGGSPILGYILECKSVPSQDWWKCKTQRKEDTTYIVTDLMKNTRYKFRIAAVNKIGPGPFSDETDCVTTLGKIKTSGERKRGREKREGMGR